MEEILVVISVVGIAVIIFGLGIILLSGSATDRDRAEMIIAANGNVEAEDLVRKTLAKKNLRSFHCYFAIRKIAKIKIMSNVKRTIEDFDKNKSNSSS